jgi:hypothetical protein
MAGVEKSALAIHVAHQLKSNFPDAQLYVNLRGTELSGKRALVLLDNARDETQVSLLLPNCSSCAVLVTSRGRLAALEEAAVFDLAVMQELEALELLQNLVGRERTQAELEAAKNLINLCNRLPLAIRIAGGMLRNKPQWQLEDCAGKIALERQRLVQLGLSDLDIRPSLSLSYQQLEETAARLFRLLGLLVGSNFTSALAAALLESEPVTAEDWAIWVMFTLDRTIGKSERVLHAELGNLPQAERPLWGRSDSGKYGYSLRPTKQPGEGYSSMAGSFNKAVPEFTEVQTGSRVVAVDRWKEPRSIPQN